MQLLVPQAAQEALLHLPAQSPAHPLVPQVAQEAPPPLPAQSLVHLQEPQAALEALPQFQESPQVSKSPQRSTACVCRTAAAAGHVWHDLTVVREAGCCAGCGQLLCRPC